VRPSLGKTTALVLVPVLGSCAAPTSREREPTLYERYTRSRAPPPVAQQTSSASRPEESAGSALAMPCQTEDEPQCRPHKCDLRQQRCAYPCASNADCVFPYSCFAVGRGAALCIWP